MKAIYNNSQNSLIAFKGDHEPIQFYKGGQLIDNLSAVPLSIEGNPAQYKSEYKKNLLSLDLEGNTFQQTYEGRNKFNVDDWVNALETAQNPDGGLSVRGEVIEYDGRKCYKLERCSYTTIWFYLPEGVHGLRLTKLSNGGTNQASFAQVRYTDGTTRYVAVGTVAQRDTWLNMSYYNSNKTIERFGIYFSATDGTTIYIDLDSIMAEYSSTPTDYEPYVGGIPSPNPQYPQTIQNAENLSVALKGINMVRFPYHFDSRTINGITFTINEDRSITAKGTATAAASFTVMYLTTALPLPKGRYFIGGIVGGSSSTYRLRLATTQKAIDDAYNDKFITVAEDTTYRYLYFVVTAGATVDTIVKPILAKVDEDIPVSYEPYFMPTTVNIPTSALFNEGTKEILLAKLGNVYDELTIDRIANKVVYNKRVNRIVFDGTEAFTGEYGYYSIDVPFIVDNAIAICSHFGDGEASQGGSLPYFFAQTGIIRFNQTGFGTLEDFVSWVQGQYANGTPLTVEYVLNNPEQYTTNGIGAEFSDIANLPTQNQTNIITVKGDIDPSKVAVTYAEWGGRNGN